MAGLLLLIFGVNWSNTVDERGGFYGPFVPKEYGRAHRFFFIRRDIFADMFRTPLVPGCLLV